MLKSNLALLHHLPLLLRHRNQTNANQIQSQAPALKPKVTWSSYTNEPLLMGQRYILTLGQKLTLFTYTNDPLLMGQR